MLMAFFVMLMATTVSTSANAQTVMAKKPTTDTLVDTDNATITSDIIADGASILVQVSAKRISGTLAGKVYLKQSANGVDYITIDSLTLSNAARDSKIFTISKTSAPALYYQAYYTSTGTVRYLPELYILRRRE